MHMVSPHDLTRRRLFFALHPKQSFYNSGSQPGVTLPSREHQETLLPVLTKGYCQHLVSRGQGCCQTPHNTPPPTTKNYLAQIVNNVEAVKLCSRTSQYFYGFSLCICAQKVLLYSVIEQILSYNFFSMIPFLWFLFLGNFQEKESHVNGEEIKKLTKLIQQGMIMPVISISPQKRIWPRFSEFLDLSPLFCEGELDSMNICTPSQ